MRMKPLLSSIWWRASIDLTFEFQLPESASVDNANVASKSASRFVEVT